MSFRSLLPLLDGLFVARPPLSVSTMWPRTPHGLRCSPGRPVLTGTTGGRGPIESYSAGRIACSVLRAKHGPGHEGWPRFAVDADESEIMASGVDGLCPFFEVLIQVRSSDASLEFSLRDAKAE